MDTLPEDHRSLAISIVALICGMWILFEGHMVVNYHVARPLTHAFPFLAFIIFPFVAILMAIASLIMEFSFLGVFALVFNVYVLIAGKNVLPMAYKIFAA